MAIPILTASGMVWNLAPHTRCWPSLSGPATTEADRLHGYFGVVRIWTGQGRGRNARETGPRSALGDAPKASSVVGRDARTRPEHSEVESSGSAEGIT